VEKQKGRNVSDLVQWVGVGGARSRKGGGRTPLGVQGRGFYGTIRMGKLELCGRARGGIKKKLLFGDG